LDFSFQQGRWGLDRSIDEIQVGNVCKLRAGLTLEMCEKIRFEFFFLNSMIRQLIPYSANIPLGHHFKLEDEMDEILRWEATEIVKSKDLRMINPTTSDRWGGLAANGTPYVAGVKKDLIPELVEDGLKDLL